MMVRTIVRDGYGYTTYGYHPPWLRRLLVLGGGGFNLVGLPGHSASIVRCRPLRNRREPPRQSGSC